jgi:hypothetical protein
VYVYTREYMSELIALDGDLPEMWDESFYNPWCGIASRSSDERPVFAR